MVVDRLPTRVIFVGDELRDPYLYETKADDTGVYAALSYCWGETRAFTTTTSTLVNRKSGFRVDDLPRTYKDAILAARHLSIPYLWIDSLCILQDSADDWNKEAAQMCSIYQNALVTFAALDSPSSDSGLVFTPPQRKTTRLNIVTSDGESATVFARNSSCSGPYSSRAIILKDHPLESRGWTLQELVLSPRILWFSESELVWSCETAAPCECGTDKWKRGEAPNAFLEKYSSQWPPDIDSLQRRWWDLVGEFTERHLTKPTDRLPAMAGLAGAIQERIGTKYVCGLWESNLARELLWRVDKTPVHSGKSSPASSNDMFREVPLPAESDLEDYAPSWSWASVTASIRDFRYTTYPMSNTPHWKIVQVHFEPRSANPFGPGQGSVTIEGTMIPLRFAGKHLVFECPKSRKNLHFCDVEDRGTRTRLVIDRANDYNLARKDSRRRLAGKAVHFMVACLAPDRRSRFREEKVYACNGLLLEALTESDQFRRLGFIEKVFNDEDSGDGTTGNWNDWKGRGERKQIVLL